MPYVERDDEGEIKGIYNRPQPGIAEEYVEGDVRLPDPGASELEIRLSALEEKAGITEADKNRARESLRKKQRV